MNKTFLRAFVSLLFVLFFTSLGQGSTDPKEEAKTAAELHAEGNKFFNQGRNQEAVAVWLNEFSLDPGNANTANNIGIAYRRLGQQETAIEYHKKAIELNPKFGHGYYSLGLAHYDRKEYEDAKDAFLKAVQFNWSKGNSYYNLGLVYHCLKDYANAEASYLKAIQFGNGSDSTYYALGGTYVGMGNYDKALTAFKEAKKINPELSGIDSQIRSCNQFLNRPLLDRIAFWKEWKVNTEGSKTSSMESAKLSEGEGWHFTVLCITFIIGVGIFALLVTKIAKNLGHRSQSS